MTAPVWVLSVDLQTRTASFQTGLGEAARSARTAFSEIRQGSNEMGRGVSTNMFEARHGVMLLGEEFGIRLPRALTAFITSIGPIGAAMEAAFPFLAIAVGATLLIQALMKVHEEGQKLTDDEVKFGTAVQTAFNALDEKLLQAGIRADELRNDHLGALEKQLKLIDMQSMAELVHTFGEVAKAADVVFGDLKSHWYTFGIGADGAKHALDQFQNQYDSLLAQGKDKEASDLLRGTRESAEKTMLSLQKSVALAGAFTPPKLDGPGGGVTDALNVVAAARTAGILKEIDAQTTLLGALNAQVEAEGKIAALKKLDDGNANRSAAGELSAQSSAAAREAAASQLRMGSAAVQADKATAEAQLTIKRGSIEQRLALDLDFAQRTKDVQIAGNAAEIAALDKLSKDYPNQLKALHEKTLEITQANALAVAEITSKSQVAAAARDLQNLEQSEREKVESTMKGTAARIAAIDAALKQEEALNLQDTSFYRDLLNQKVEATRQMTEEAGKLAEEAGREAAQNAQKMGELQLAAWKTNQALQDSSRRISEQQKIAEQTQAENAEYALKIQAMAREMAALDKSEKDFQNKLREKQDKEKQLIQEHENELAAIREKAEQQQNDRILASRQRFDNAIASGLTSSIMSHQSWAKTLDSLGDQMISNMISNTIKYILNNKSQQMSDARAAAAAAYKTGESIGGPIGLVLGPTFAATAFTGVMAFSGGGVVPGLGRGDTVPALLTPGEGIVPNSMMHRLDDLSRSGGMGGAKTYHLHAPFSVNVSALDGDGVDTVFEKHSSKIQRHFENAVRRMNK